MTSTQTRIHLKNCQTYDVQSIVKMPRRTSGAMVRVIDLNGAEVPLCPAFAVERVEVVTR